MIALIVSGVELMLVGMGIVFLFLGMLIAAIQLMSVLIGRFFPVVENAISAAKSPRLDQSSIAAISAAVHQYRNQHK